MIKSLLSLFLLTHVSLADFFKVPLNDLKIEVPEFEVLRENFESRTWQGGFQSSVPIPRFAEFAFVVPGLEKPLNERDRRTVGEAFLLIELDQAGARQGFLDVWDAEKREWQSLACRIDPKKLVKCGEEELKNGREWHASNQLQVGARGGLWYRSQVQSGGPGARDDGFKETFTTLSGGRALAENLALDRALILGEEAEGEPVDLSTIKGVTVEAIPWKERMPGGEIAVDGASLRVPEDQYLMVVPSLKKLFGLMDRVQEAGTPILQSFALGDQYRELPLRYRRQLGLDLPDVLARLLPVKTVAVTGGDPFFPTGSDLAVILETDQVDFVFTSLQNTIAAKARRAGAEKDGAGFRNATRTFSSYLIKLEGAVAVANSAVQVKRLKEVAERKSHALGATDEYRFFRHRYPIDAEESAYLFISDACLRQWAGPKVRIAASRRSRAIAALAKLTSGVIEGRPLSQEFEPLLGKVSQVGELVVSERFGNLGFLTPISEVEVTQVSTMEKRAYEGWLDGYEGGWARFFDPIAMRFELKKDREVLDMTILPLRVDSDYQDFVNLAGKAILSKASQTVPGESLLHFAMAVDHESELFKEANVGLIDFLPVLKVNPLGWMGESFSFTMGNTLAWRSEMNGEMLSDLPVLLRIDVQSRLKLALFLTAVKGAMEISSPDLVSWETRKHGERKYVAVIGDPDEMGMDVSIYYAALPTALMVSLNEDMLKRALDREATFERGAKGEGQLFAETSPDFLKVLGEMTDSRSLDERRRNLSWSALPILNEWYLSKSAKDPVAYHEARFASQITCPGGLGYRWNGTDFTMESLAYGHPGGPRDEAKPLEIFKRFQTMEMSASFEEGGMRMEVAMDEKSNFKIPLMEGTKRPEDADVVLLSELFSMTPGMTQKFEIETVVGDDVKKVISKFQVNLVSKEGDLTIVDQTYRALDGDEKWVNKMKYELGPKGLRLLAATGDRAGIVDEKCYEFPVEVWPGKVFRVRKSGTWTPDDQKIPLLREDIVKVIGWEKITVGNGKEMEALRLEWDSSSISDKHFSRSSMTEWRARGLGIVKSEVRSKWHQMTSTLIETTEPKKGGE
jgi:hypothetical protein